MVERRWEPIIPHLRDFQRHLTSDIPQLRIQPANDRQWSQQRYREQCKTGVFNQYGVYLLFAPDESLEYIGVTMNGFHDRVWSRDDVVNRRWTDVIPLAHEHYFLSLALEFFLICRLQPPKNHTYRGYTIPGDARV